MSQRGSSWGWFLVSVKTIVSFASVCVPHSCSNWQHFRQRLSQMSLATFHTCRLFGLKQPCIVKTCFTSTNITVALLAVHNKLEFGILQQQWSISIFALKIFISVFHFCPNLGRNIVSSECCFFKMTLFSLWICLFTLCVSSSCLTHVQRRQTEEHTETAGEGQTRPKEIPQTRASCVGTRWLSKSQKKKKKKKKNVCFCETLFGCGSAAVDKNNFLGRCGRMTTALPLGLSKTRHGLL